MAPAATARPGGPAVGPGPTAVSLAWDAADGYVLALAPDITGNYTSTITNLSEPSQTWTFVGGTWTELHPAHAPSSRGFAAMTYDARDGYVLMFGGVPTYGFCVPYEVTNHPQDPFYNCYNDTWSYVHGTWQNLTPSLSPPHLFDGTTGYQTGPELVYDASDGYALLYGENNSETWAYGHGHWTNLTATSGGPPGEDGAMVYDDHGGYVLYFGGAPSGYGGLPFAGTTDTWEFAHGSWTNVSDPFAIQPAPRSFASLAYDSATGRVVLFGGIEQSGGTAMDLFDAWTYSGSSYGTLGSWNEMSGSGGPTPRFAAQFVFDPVDNESVLVGGASVAAVTDTVTEYRDTWALAAPGWESAGPLLASARSSVDTGTHVTISVIDLPFDALASGSFVYSGLPPGCLGENAPVLNCTPLVPGVYEVSVAFSSGLGGANATLALTVNPDPQVQAVELSRSVSEPGVPVTIGASIAGGTGPFSFIYSSLPGCAPVNAPSFACDPTATGTFPVRVTVSDALGLQATLTQNLAVVPDLQLAPVHVSPSATDVGRVAVAVVGLSGGIAPFTVAYLGLPTGCLSANTTSLACRPSAPGSYGITVGASDSTGYAVSARATLQVNADPSISAFTSSPAPTEGQPLVLTLALSGGTGLFNVSYQGLPWGCTGSNSTIVRCVPSVAGTFGVVATATDAVGYTVSQPLTLVVAAAAGSGPSNSGLGPFGTSSFDEGLLAGLVALVVVALAGGAWASSSARDDEARRLPEELLDRAGELADEVEDPGEDGRAP
jgi:hypothetical protein